MTKLTEQQKTDLFKGAPDAYNYYAGKYVETWFKVVDGYVNGEINIKTGCVRSTSYKLEDLLECGAIKRPEPKEETNMIYTQEMHDNGEWPTVGMRLQGFVLSDTSCNKWIEGVFAGMSQPPTGGFHFLLECGKGDCYAIHDMLHIKPLPPVKTKTTDIHPKEETSMTYTQEMHDNGVLPIVGMKFIDSKDSNQIVNTCLFINKGEAVYSFGLHSYQSAAASECLPLPPVKTELEIAQEKQVIDTAIALAIESCNVTDIAVSHTAFISSAKHLQEKGMLAEIILPVKG
jgi:hypothetical protein